MMVAVRLTTIVLAFFTNPELAEFAGERGGGSEYCSFGGMSLDLMIKTQAS